MKAAPESPDLATLRALCGQPIPPDGSGSIQRYMLRPSRWELRTEVRPLRAPEEIAGKIDGRPLRQLKDQSGDALRQIVVRAAAGDENAIAVLLTSARATIEALRTIEKIQTDKLHAIAESSPNWPVLLSVNPQDIKAAKQYMDCLNVGAKAVTPRRRTQRLDPRGFWTQLAAIAFQGCQDNQVLVPVLEAHCAGTKPERERKKIWGISSEASFHYVSPTDCIVIAEWEKQCVNLSLPVTKDNLQQWWDVVKCFVLDYWRCYPQEYQEALRQIGRADEKEYRRRNLAMTELRQAFRSLVGLR